MSDSQSEPDSEWNENGKDRRRMATRVATRTATEWRQEWRREWRRKYEKESDKAKKLQSENELMRLELELMRPELERWRNGETVPLDERCDMQKELVFNDSAAHGRGDGVNTPTTCSTPLTSIHHGVNKSG